MIDDEEALVEKIDYYANKVNVFFAMQPATETLSKLAENRRNITRMIQEAKKAELQSSSAKTTRATTIGASSTSSSSGTIENSRQITIDDFMIDDDFDFGGGLGGDDFMFEDLNDILLQVKPKVTIKKKTKTDNSKSSTSSSPLLKESTIESKKEIKSTQEKSQKSRKKQKVEEKPSTPPSPSSPSPTTETPKEETNLYDESEAVENSAELLDHLFKHNRGKHLAPPNFHYYPSEDIQEQLSFKHLLYPCEMAKNSSLQNVQTFYRNSDNICYQGIPFLPAQSLYCPKKATPSQKDYLLDSDAELSALQIARIDATLPEIRIQRLLRHVVKDDLSLFEKDYQFNLFLRKNNEGEDIPFTSYYKPYLKRRKCENLLKMEAEDLKELGLLHGDLIHCPFTPAEAKIIKYLKHNKWNNKKIAILFDNRISEDIKNYWDDISNGEGQHGEAFTFYEKPIPLVCSKTINELMASREIKTSDLTLNKHVNIKKIYNDLPDSDRFNLNTTYRQCWQSPNVTKSSFSDFSGSIVEIAFDKSSERMAAISTNSEPNAYLFDLKEGKRVKLQGHLDTVTDVKFTQDGKVVTSSFDKAIRVFGSDGTLLKTIKKSENSEGHDNEVSLLAIHPDDSHVIASCSEKDKSVKFWDIRSGSMIIDLMAREKVKTEISGMEFGKDNVFYAMSILSSDKKHGEIFLYDVNTYQLLDKIRTKNNGTEAFSLSHCGKKIAIGGENGTVHVYDTKEKNLIGDIHNTRLHNRVSFVNWSADDTYMATGGYDGLVRVVDQRMNQVLFTFRHSLEFIQKQGATRSCWSNQPGTSLLVTCGDNYATQVYSISSGNPFVTSFEEKKFPVSAVSISPDDLTICSGDDMSNLFLFSLSGYDISK
ncbi:predicted protein [Naegleria gruberi]|uniref:Predicted protein n=1 Tax=Naegleria gruberi TaxID=5762 RepID=D2VQ56_NAEGR|nr:uncharacterized protein NAEGRDRAFT_58880 [Naegleria gruberi]EFC41046.1 predicted protein [Naegleria gruberi]|eukprot:XP_002673790.1 predicted protein [Naegleria gruberi strain NEG-M]